MKNLLIILIVVLFMFGNSFAQDTVVVDPGLNTLADAVENSANFGKVFLLKRSGVYVNDRTMTAPDSIHNMLYITGEAEPADQRPAIIQAYMSDPTWEVMIGIDKASDIKFENIGFYCYNQDGLNLLGAFDVYKVGANVEINNCFFDGSNWATFFTEADSVNMTIKNSLFLNSIGNTFFQQGHLYEGWGVTGATKFSIHNNTMVGFGGPGEGFGIRVDTVEYLHNTWCMVDRELAQGGYMGKINRIFENNIIYDVAMRGYVGPRPDWREHPDSSGYPGDNAGSGPPSPIDSVRAIFNVDSLYLQNGDSTYLGPKEDERYISFRNNLCYTSQLVRDFQTEITATKFPLINNRGAEMFANFANKTSEGNIDETVNPNFVVPVPDEAYQPYFKNTKERRNLSIRSDEYPVYENWNWGNLSDISHSYELPWPVPINLKPQAPEVDGAGTDGYPLGDLNWWGKQVIKDWEAGHIYTGINETTSHIPTKFVLSQNYPNPFNPSTVISYQISKPANVTLEIYNVNGQKIRTLVNKQQQAGINEVTWNGKDNGGKQVVSGVYFYKLKVGDNIVDVKKMILLK